MTVAQRNPAFRPDHPAGFDTGNATPADPHDVDRAGAVPQFGLQGRRSAARLNRDRTQHADDTNLRAVEATLDGRAATFERLLLPVLSFEHMLWSRQPVQSPAQHAG